MRYGMAITKTEILNQNGNHLFTLDPGYNFEIKHFGLLPGSFHPLVLKKLAGPFPDGASQDVIHCINLLKKSLTDLKFLHIPNIKFGSMKRVKHFKRISVNSLTILINIGGIIILKNLKSKIVLLISKLFEYYRIKLFGIINL